MQKLCQSYYVSHNETLKPDKIFCYDFVIRMFFHLASFFGSSTADYLVPRPSIPHRGTASVYLLLMCEHLTVRGYTAVVVDQKGISAEFLPKVSAEIRQKVFLHLFGLSVLLQKHFLLAECQSFCRNCFFLQANSFLGYFILM